MLSNLKGTIKSPFRSIYLQTKIIVISVLLMASLDYAAITSYNLTDLSDSTVKSIINQTQTKISETLHATGSPCTGHLQCLSTCCSFGKCSSEFNCFNVGSGYFAGASCTSNNQCNENYCCQKLGYCFEKGACEAYTVQTLPPNAHGGISSDLMALIIAIPIIVVGLIIIGCLWVYCHKRAMAKKMAPQSQPETLTVVSPRAIISLEQVEQGQTPTMIMDDINDIPLKSPVYVSVPKDSGRMGYPATPTTLTGQPSESQTENQADSPMKSPAKKP